MENCHLCRTESSHHRYHSSPLISIFYIFEKLFKVIFFVIVMHVFLPGPVPSSRLVISAGVRERKAPQSGLGCGVFLSPSALAVSAEKQRTFGLLPPHLRDTILSSPGLSLPRRLLHVYLPFVEAIRLSSLSSSKIFPHLGSCIFT